MMILLLNFWKYKKKIISVFNFKFFRLLSAPYKSLNISEMLLYTKISSKNILNFFVFHNYFTNFLIIADQKSIIWPYI